MGLHKPDALGAALVVLIAIPVVIAARHPLGAFTVSATALLAYAFLGYPASPANLATLGLLAWVVAIARPSRSGPAMAALTAGSGIATLFRPGVHTPAEVGGAMLAPALAALAGMALRAQRERATLARREQELALAGVRMAAERAAAEERLRVAREVHDAVGHSVTLFTLQIEAAERVLRVDPTRARDLLGGATAHGRQAMADLHQLLGVLRETRPLTAGHAELNGSSGSEAPEDLFDVVRRFNAAGLPTALETNRIDLALPVDVARAMTAITTEALSNVARHADAHRARVKLQNGEGELLLEVADDGRGPQGAVFGFGLTGAAERAKKLGGQLEMVAGPDGGTLVRVRLPHAQANLQPRQA